MILRWAVWSERKIKLKQDAYLMLGDDIVLFDEMVCRDYTKMLRILRMPESKGKRLTSGTGFEFCKRLFAAGHEISPYSWNMFSLPPIERYLEVTRVSLNRLSSSSDFVRFSKGLEPKLNTDIESQALNIYMQLMIYSPLSEEVMSNKSGETNCISKQTQNRL